MKNSFIDKIFILIILLCLIIPIFNFKELDTKRFENRKINTFPTNYGNKYFAKRFERYISDRFCFKYKLVYLDRNLKFLLTKNYYTKEKDTIDKKNKLIYSSSFWGMYNITSDYFNVIESIKRFDYYCKSKNIKLYFLVVPRRSNFIKYNTYDNRLKDNKLVFDNGEETVNLLKANTNVSVIYPLEEMLTENKVNPVYYKTDHHWTDSGVYVSYVALMKEIKKFYPDVKILNRDDFTYTYSNKVNSNFASHLNYGALLKRSGITGFIAEGLLDTQYKYYHFHDAKSLRISKDARIRKFDPKYDNLFYYDKGYDKKVMVIGDSFTGGLLKILPYAFKETINFSDNPRMMYFEEYEGAIEDFKPDIIIINVRSFYMFVFNNLYKVKESKK